MAFWDRMNAELKKAVDGGWTAVRDSAKSSKLRYDVHNLHKRAEKLFTELGGIVYEISERDGVNPLDNPKVKRIIGDIKKLQAQSEVMEQEVASLKKREAPAVAAPPKKAAPKEAAPKKTAAPPKKAALKKAAAKKAAPKKAASKKSAPKKTASKKAAPKKTVGNQGKVESEGTDKPEKS